MKPGRSSGASAPLAGSEAKASRGLKPALLGVFVVIGVVRIVSTYKIFSETWDEVAWNGSRTELTRSSPCIPLSPAWRSRSGRFWWASDGIRNWACGRGAMRFLRPGTNICTISPLPARVLPFFVICAFLTWFWAATRYGATAAGTAALFFTTCPVILGHAGLATTDMAAAARFMGGLLNFIIGSTAPQIPDPPSSAPPPPWACFANSAFPFSCSRREPVCGWQGLLKRGEHSVAPSFRWGRGLVVTPAAATLVLWAGFRFTFGSLSEYAERPYQKIDRLTGSRGPAHNAAYAVVESKWIPAIPLLKGVAQMGQKEKRGEKRFLLGQIRSSGWCYFFLVALASKRLFRS